MEQKVKTQLAEIPVTFRVEQPIHDFIADVMIERRIFNKSQIHREIFLIGLEEFKKRNNK